MELLIIIGLVMLNGVFAMSEISLVASRRFKLENAVKKGSKAAKTALELSENPTRFLSTVQIGITLIGILLGVYSGENLTNDVEAFLGKFKAVRVYAHQIAITTIVVFITFLSIVLGELLPKRIGLTFPEPIAIRLAPLMKVLSVMASPFVWLLTSTNDLILNFMGIKRGLDSKVTEEEIKSIIKESAETGEIQDIEHNIVERVFELGDRRVDSLMTHQSDLVFFNDTDDLAEVRRKVSAEKYSAYPVCHKGEVDQILGIVLLEDLFGASDAGAFSLKNFLKKPLLISETMPAYKLLELFKGYRPHFAIVLDEFGSTKGMVTMDDLLDALVGNVGEQEEEKYKIEQRDENSWFVDGQYPVYEFLKQFNLVLEPKQQHRFSTVAGLVLSIANALPKVGDRFNLDGYRLEVLDMDGQRVDKILVTKY